MLWLTPELWSGKSYPSAAETGSAETPAASPLGRDASRIRRVEPARRETAVGNGVSRGPSGSVNALRIRAPVRAAQTRSWCFARSR
jgi:hypothetical protein